MCALIGSQADSVVFRGNGFTKMEIYRFFSSFWFSSMLEIDCVYCVAWFQITHTHIKKIEIHLIYRLGEKSQKSKGGRNRMFDDWILMISITIWLPVVLMLPKISPYRMDCSHTSQAQINFIIVFFLIFAIISFHFILFFDWILICQTEEKKRIN